MTKLELLQWLEKQAKHYRHIARDSVCRNKHMNKTNGSSTMSQDEIDALLVDFINYCGVQQGLDYGLYTRHFYSEES